ncbi:hypothetical protein TNCV_1427061 [Trichonephila clavipes]|nr:hypothetical protein TNCV_1427061 [Trichonephila clavipes]
MVNLTWQDPGFTNGINVLKRADKLTSRNAENVVLVPECVRKVITKYLHKSQGRCSVLSEQKCIVNQRPYFDSECTSVLLTIKGKSVVVLDETKQLYCGYVTVGCRRVQRIAVDDRIHLSAPLPFEQANCAHDCNGSFNHITNRSTAH